MFLKVNNVSKNVSDELFTLFRISSSSIQRLIQVTNKIDVACVCIVEGGGGGT